MGQGVGALKRRGAGTPLQTMNNNQLLDQALKVSK